MMMMMLIRLQSSLTRGVCMVLSLVLDYFYSSQRLDLCKVGSFHFCQVGWMFKDDRLGFGVGQRIIGDLVSYRRWS